MGNGERRSYRYGDPNYDTNYNVGNSNQNYNTGSGYTSSGTQNVAAYIGTGCLSKLGVCINIYQNPSWPNS